MPNTLIAPRPSNLVTKTGRQPVMVEGDVYDITNRIKEFDPNLRVVLHEDHPEPWVVMELGPDGEERFVSRYAELDARILEHLRYMLAVPFEKRLAKLEREADKNNAKLNGMDEEQFDRFSWEFLKAAKDSNIINPKWLKNG